ncbi:MAG: 6-bladed beta-propeller [Acidobacteriota bacterium]|nr:6-bladed beta-propeller [Acidobacteriota bacterium]
MFAMLFALLAVDPVAVETVLTLEPLPEEDDLFFERPVDLAVDARGGIYVLDIEAKRVFIYDKSGSFKKAFGSSGSAPGEFTFSGRRGSGTGFIAVYGERLYVFDGARREISVFGLADLKFQKALPFKTQRSRTNAFWTIDENTFLFYQRTFTEAGPREVVRLLDGEGKELALLMENEITGFRPRGRRGRGRPRGPITITAFSPSTVVGYDAVNRRIIAGYSETAGFGIYDAKGKNTKNLSFKIPRMEVTQTDKEEYNSQERMKSGRLKAEFPEQKQFYQRVISIGKEGFLVFNISPLYRDITGFMIDEKGQVKARFNFHCGENGDLLGESGRLFAIRTNEEGDFSIEEIGLKPKG